MFLLQQPGVKLLRYVMLLRDFHLSRVLAPEATCEGRHSDLDTEEEIEIELTTHIREIVRAKIAGSASIEGIVQLFVRTLKQEVDDFQQTLLAPTAVTEINVMMIVDYCETYFLACTVHPEIDIGGDNADWLKDLFRQQPCYSKVTEQHSIQTDSNAEEIFPSLVQLLRESLSSEGEDFVRVFEVFGRWALIAAMDLWEGEWSSESLGDEESFVMHITNDLEAPLSPVPLHIRAAICNINIRHTYRVMVDQVKAILESDLGLNREDVLGHRVFRWILSCAMSSSLDPQHKNRISSWMQRCGLDRILTSQYPVGVMVPGQKVLSRLSMEWGPVEASAADEQQNAVERRFVDVGFEPVDPPLNSSIYATQVAEFYPWNGEVCNVCMEDLADGFQRGLRIDTCGHMVHEDCLVELINGIDEWSNKCPTCRQEICPQRQKRALIDEDCEYDEEDGTEMSEDEDEDEDEETEGTETSSEYRYEEDSHDSDVMELDRA